MKILRSLPKKAIHTGESLLVYKNNGKTYLKVTTEETDYIVEYEDGSHRLRDLITLLALKEQE